MPDDPPAVDHLTRGDAVERVVCSHPWIARADRTADGALVVTASPSALAVRRERGRPPVVGGLVREHLEHWAEVYDWTYRSGEGRQAPDLDISGWRATDTGRPLPAAHMAEWADRTVELVLRNRPSRLLELGCGTGMLLHRLHPHLQGYAGTDISEHVVERLAALALAGVRVVRAAAHDVHGAAVGEALAGLGGPVDCVLLNSVTQCFPCVGYLAAVLHDAIALVAPGGTVVVGDVRHAGLLDAHYRWLEQAADPGVGEPDLTRRARRRAAADTELLLDPATLATVAAGTGRLVTVSLLAKTLTADTELTRYRFDAVLHVDPVPTPEPTVREWGDLGPDWAPALAALVRSARATGPVRVHGIPNRLLRRPADDTATGGPPAVTGAALRAAFAGEDAAVLIDPDDPSRLQVAAPGAAAATALDLLVGVSRAHEPLGAFARPRLIEVAVGAVRRAGLPEPTTVTARLPTGPAQDKVGLADEAAAADRAGRRALGRGDEEVPDSALRRLPVAVRHFDEIALQALARLMARSGALVEGAARTEEEVVDALGTAARHAWIVTRWLAVLAAEGRAHRDPDGRYRLGALEHRAELEPSGPTLGRACADLGYPPTMARFFREALTQLPRLLGDEIMAQALLFPDGDMLTSLSKDQDNVSNRYLSGALAHVVGRAAASRAAPLRVVELGAGAGGSTAAALRGLGAAEVDYLCTDVSRFFTLAAEERFGRHRGLRYGLLDVDRDLVEQGLARGGTDVVIAANVLHCARHVGRSLRWIRELLAPGGLLVVTESVREHYLVLATMQFLLSPRDGRPNIGTGDRRGGTGRVFLVGNELVTEMSEAGLRPVLDLPAADSPLAAPAQHLIVASPI